MNIDAKIVKQYLRPLFLPSKMVTMLSARNVKVKMSKSRYLLLQAVCPAAQVVPRQEPFQVAHPSRVFPEHDLMGARWLL